MGLLLEELVVVKVDVFVGSHQSGEATDDDAHQDHRDVDDDDVLSRQQLFEFLVLQHVHYHSR